MITSIMLYSIINFIIKNNPKYIKKIRSSIENSFIITLRCEENDINIYVSPKEGIFLPTYYVPYKTPLHPEYKKVRDLIEGSRIINIYQPSLERIVVFNVKKEGNEYNVIIELFGKGNLILTDRNWRILYIMNPIRTEKRTLILGEEYKFPDFISLNDLLNTRTYEDKVLFIKDLYRFLPFDKYTISYITYELRIKDKVSKEHIKKLVFIIKKLLETAATNNQNCLIKVNENKNILMPFKPSNYEIITCMDDILELCTEYLNNYIIKYVVNRSINDQVKKIELKINNLLKQKSQLLANINKIERSIPKLYERFHFIENILSSVRSGDFEQYSTYIEKIDKRNKRVWIKIDDHIIPLRYNVSLHKSIGELFDEVKKMKKGLSIIDDKIDSLNKSIESVKSRVIDRLNQQIWIIKRRREWFEKFRWFYTTNNLLVIAGKDAKTNEILIKRYLEPQDMVLHADIKGSPFTIIKNGMDSSRNEDIYEAAIFTAAYSNAWKYGFSAVDVYWVKPDQISKKAPSGEYLSKGAFMIYGKKNYLRNISLMLCVGVLRMENYPILVIAPCPSIKNNNNVTVIGELKPGSLYKGEIARKIISCFENFLGRKLSKYDKEFLYNDIIERLPPGKSIFMSFY